METIFFNLTLPSLREEGGQGKGWESILGMIVLSQEQKELSKTIPHSEKITEFIERTLKNIGTMCKNGTERKLFENQEHILILS